MYYFTEYLCTGTNGQTGSRTNASCGRGTSEGTCGQGTIVGTRGCGTSATEDCQSRNSSPSKRYTCTIY